MTTQEREGTHVGTRANGRLTVLCGRRNVRAFMSPETFSEIVREKASPYRGHFCKATGLWLYGPRPERKPENARAPTLF